MSTEPLNVVKSADRVLDVFELLASRRRPMSHTEIGETLSIPKSSLTQLLRNLEARGYLQLIPGPNTFELGPALFALAHEARSELDLVKLAQPFVEQVTAQCNESASFNVPRADGVECIFSSNSSHALMFIMAVGQIAPMHAVSSGKAILAFLPEDERESILQTLAMPKVTEHTKTSADALRKELRKVAKEGVAYSFEEFTPGIVGVAVPVFNGENRPIGAVNVAVPAVRYQAKKAPALIETLSVAARGITAELEVMSTRIASC